MNGKNNMNQASSMGRDGYYDDKGHWHRTKLCTVPCPNCTCTPPGGMWVIHVKKDKTKGDDNV